MSLSSSHDSRLTTHDSPAVSPARIRDWLRAFARIGYSPDGGMRRLAYTRPDLRARQLLLHTFERLGLRAHIDGIGNCFGYLACGREPDAPPVLVGSHLDTVPGGGRFDGAIGVVAALELAATIREHNIATRRPIAIVSFAAEESSRFGRGTIGSGVLAGTWDPEEALTLRDAHGRAWDKSSLVSAPPRLLLRRRGANRARSPPTWNCTSSRGAY